MVSNFIELSPHIFSISPTCPSYNQPLQELADHALHTLVLKNLLPRLQRPLKMVKAQVLFNPSGMG